jgi:hypothetical protein
MSDLKTLLKQYRDADNEVRRLNDLVAGPRKDRSDLESKIHTKLVDPVYNGIDKLVLEDDGSTIRINHNTTRSWSLSQDDLERHLSRCAGSEWKRMAEFIIAERKKELTGGGFSMKRNVKNE